MKKFMELAIKEANKGIKKRHGGPFGAIIVKNNKVISKAHNRVIKNNDATAHAEILAIKKASKKIKNFNLEGCEIYSTSEPCSMCLSAIYWANISKIYYGCSKKDAEKIGFRDASIGQKIRKKHGKEISKKECLNLFKKYSKIKNKTNY